MAVDVQRCAACDRVLITTEEQEWWEAAPWPPNMPMFNCAVFCMECGDWVERMRNMYHEGYEVGRWVERDRNERWMRGR